jgi:hypothetical protein
MKRDLKDASHWIGRTTEERILRCSYCIQVKAKSVEGQGKPKSRAREKAEIQG